MKILISAAGTGAGFHIAELAASGNHGHFKIYLCDTNPAHLVAASVFAKECFRVPLASEPEFKPTILKILERLGIDLYIPILDRDVYLFSSDDPDLVAAGVRSSSPPRATGRVLSSKSAWTRLLAAAGLDVPRTYSHQDLSKLSRDEKVFLKPDDGWGSRHTAIKSVGNLLEEGAKALEGMICQEVCSGTELTVEVFNRSGETQALVRERLEVKAGVCTKARAFFDEELSETARLLCRALEMPVAFCFQVLRNSKGKWAITDINPRLGAGTSLCSACGWSLAAAALRTWANPSAPVNDLLQAFTGNRFAVRVYRDVRTS